MSELTQLLTWLGKADYGHVMSVVDKKMIREYAIILEAQENETREETRDRLKKQLALLNEDIEIIEELG